MTIFTATTSNNKSAGWRLVSWSTGAIAKGIPGICQVVVTPASLEYPPSVLNKDFTFTEIMSKDIMRGKNRKNSNVCKFFFEFFEFLCGELLLCILAWHWMCRFSAPVASETLEIVFSGRPWDISCWSSFQVLSISCFICRISRCCRTVARRPPSTSRRLSA